MRNTAPHNPSKANTSPPMRDVLPETPRKKRPAGVRTVAGAFGAVCLIAGAASYIGGRETADHIGPADNDQPNVTRFTAELDKGTDIYSRERAKETCGNLATKVVVSITHTPGEPRAEISVDDGRIPTERPGDGWGPVCGENNQWIDVAAVPSPAP
ncbi:MAG TPA: hypothetical protein VD735_08010 [Candidatus Saccharimonadales bacterium]|nr:hypothetical protein [Candidatus Saccharimonadales bacterium]